MSATRRAETAAVAAMAFLLIASVAWWALALWPPSPGLPDWLERTRQVCFNARPDGLPDASGWLLLIGQPIGMFATLMAIAGPAVRSGLAGVARTASGRAALAGVAVLLVGGLVAGGLRVSHARDAAAPAWASAGGPDERLPDTYPRLDREAPELDLVDQYGERVALASLHGRPALVTFAFGHCETVCPMIVHDCVEAQARVRERASKTGARSDASVPRVVVVTLDPWRDTPSRLPHIARGWALEEDAHLLSGPVERVGATLDRWNVARRRDPASGEVVHPPLVYVLDAQGRIQYASSGGSAALVELLERAGRS